MNVVLVLVCIVLTVATAQFAFTAGPGIASGIQNAFLGGLIVFLLSAVTGRLSMKHSKGMFVLTGICNAVLVFAGLTFGAGGSWLFGGIMTVMYIVGANFGIAVPLLRQIRPR